MATEGPGKFGGSRATVRKRAQRKRKAAKGSSGSPVRNQSSKATLSTRPVLDRSESDVEHRVGMMVDELVSISVQIRKSLTNSGKHFDSISQDLKRAEKVIKGAIKDNDSRK